MGEPAARVQTLTSMGNEAPADRRIWLVADDYGISRAVNAAIRDLLAFLARSENIRAECECRLKGSAIIVPRTATKGRH